MYSRREDNERVAPVIACELAHRITECLLSRSQAFHGVGPRSVASYWVCILLIIKKTVITTNKHKK